MLNLNLPNGYLIICLPMRLADDIYAQFLDQIPTHVKGMQATGSEAEYMLRKAVRPAANVSEGKTGELFAQQFMQEFFNVSSSVDMAIYEADQKRHDADLSELGIGVKTCTDVTLSFVGQPSGTYQYGRNQDPIFRRLPPELRNRHDLLVYVPEALAQVGVIVSMANQYEIRRKLIPPKKESLLLEKKCLSLTHFEYREDFDTVDPCTVNDWKEYFSQLLRTV